MAVVERAGLKMSMSDSLRLFDEPLSMYPPCWNVETPCESNDFTTVTVVGSADRSELIEADACFTMGAASTGDGMDFSSAIGAAVCGGLLIGYDSRAGTVAGFTASAAGAAVAGSAAAGSAVAAGATEAAGANVAAAGATAAADGADAGACPNARAGAALGAEAAVVTGEDFEALDIKSDFVSVVLTLGETISFPPATSAFIAAD